MRELDRIIEKNGSTRPTLLLHACCGPCSSSVLEFLVKHFDITVLWYNPNIYPLEEYNKRFETLKELIEKLGIAGEIKIMAEPHRSEDYYKNIKGLENEPEGGRRCTECFRVRLLEAAKVAKEHNFDYYCTTLTLSRHKNAVLINQLAEEIAQQVGVKWLPSEFKKRNGENRSIELCEQFNLYRQLYCGCEFSLHRRQENAHEEQ